MRLSIRLAVAALVLGGLGGATAQGHDHAQAARGGLETPSTRAFKASHERMMAGMDIAYTGDPDVDFRVQMIPHHQGAIDMARVAMRHAKDPWTRQLAESIIVEQQREIAEMRAWLARRGVAVSSAAEPTHVMGADSYRSRSPEAGTRSEAVGQSWAPGAGIR